MKDYKEFTLTADHVAILRRANVDWIDYAYEGAAGLNLKRPYGNQDWQRDIATVLGWTLFEDADEETHFSAEQAAAASRLHRETETALSVILAAGQFTPGVYRTSDPYSRDWHLIEATA